MQSVFLFLTAVYLLYVVSGFLAHPDWTSAAGTRWSPARSSTATWLLTVIAAIGTTITPWGQFFIQAYVVDKHISVKEYAYTKAEVFLGALFTDGIDFFIVDRLRRHPVRHGIVVNTAQDAARALGPLAGQAASLLFGIGLLNVSILGACILPLATAYAFCEAFGFEASLDSSFSEAPAFHGLLARVHLRARAGGGRSLTCHWCASCCSRRTSTASCCRSSSSSCSRS